MRIGLIRHFPVEEPLPSGWRTAGELHAWRKQYDSSPAVIGQVDAGTLPWSVCLSSDLRRALATAEAAFTGPIEVTPLLREPEFAEFQTGAMRFPIWVWRWVFRLTWMTGHESQRSGRDDFHRRVRAVADRLETEGKDILVVSHAGMMAYLSAELRRRGFSGPKLRVPKHAELYVYEKTPVRRPRSATTPSPSDT